MREPPITVTCDCGTAASLAYGERWTCPTCGKAWNTARSRGRSTTRCSGTCGATGCWSSCRRSSLAAILIPLGVLVDIRFAFLLFLLEIGVRAAGRAAAPPAGIRCTSSTQTPSWKLRPE